MSSSDEKVDLGTHFYGSESGKAVAVSGVQRSFGRQDVLIEIVSSGVCGTDLHQRKRKIALGHEGVGIVNKIGSEVTLFKVGDRVGCGFVHDADLSCKDCLQGYDTLCAQAKLYGKHDLEQASLGSFFVIKQTFVHRIPDNIPLRYAGPLQCGGATVFGAIYQADIKPYQRVGVVGIGGLGHLAIQYLKAWGCEIVTFSTTENKRDEAMKLGAHEFVATKSNPDLKDVRPIDHLLVSSDRQIPWKTYFNVLANNGTVIPLAVSKEDMKGVPYMEIIHKQIRIMGSFVANRYIHERMLEFSARHQIFPIIEELSLSEEGVNEALDRLEKGDVRYRFVLSSNRKDPLFA